MDEQRKSESELVPALRFEGFTDPWEQRKLGEVVDVHNGKDYKHLKPGSIPVYGTGGLMTYVDDALSKNEDAVGVGRKGTIDQPYKLRAPFWTVDTLFYAVPKAGNDIEFVLCCFQRINWKAKDESTGLPSLSKSAINNTRLLTPRSGEQVRIGALFAKIDSLIALHQRKYEKLKTVKQSLLEKMFPKEGEDVPELRFEGFTDPWEQRKLGELFAKGGSGGTPTATEPSYYNGEIPFLGIADIEDRYIDSTAKSLTEDGLNNSAAWVVPSGAICLAMYASVGKVGICELDLATSQAFYNMVFDSQALRDYVYARLDKADANAEWEPLISTGTQANLNAEKVKGFQMAVPCCEEADLVGSFFRGLDSLIALHQRELEILKNLKKALLEKMFV